MSAATPDSLVCAPPSQAVPVACLALTTAYWLPTTAVKFLRLRYEPVSPWDSITCRATLRQAIDSKQPPRGRGIGKAAVFCQGRKPKKGQSVLGNV